MSLVHQHFKCAEKYPNNKCLPTGPTTIPMNLLNTGFNILSILLFQQGKMKQVDKSFLSQTVAGKHLDIHIIIIKRISFKHNQILEKIILRQINSY